MWWIYALLSALFAAITAIFAKVGVKNVNPDVATAIRTVVVLFIAWGIVFARGEAGEISGLTKTNWMFLCFSGLATGLSWIFYFKALQLGNVSQVAPIDKLSVALVLIFAIVFLKEPASLKTIIGGILIVAGTIFMIN